jgi:hypothetical protein
MALEVRVDEQVIRAWWAHRQGLDGSRAGAEPAMVLERTGWHRSLGGIGPYLAIFARSGQTRAAIERAVVAGELQELPSARGCMYMVPAAHAALALRLGQGWGEEAEISSAKKGFGVTEDELACLSQSVLAALAGEPVEPRELKEAVRDNIRDFGPEGKKRGLTTTLALVLGRLEARGEVRRIAIEGRLDAKRYRYARWLDSPLARQPLSQEEAHVELARCYFQWAGPARMAHFQWFSGLSGKAAKAATASLGLVPLADGDDRLMLPEDSDALRAFNRPKEPQIVLTSFFDNAVHLRRDVAGLVERAEDLGQLYGEFGSQQAGGLSDLQSHLILDRGTLIGLWEYDAATRAIVWGTFAPPPAALADALARMEAFIHEDLGDSPFLSFDWPKGRVKRMAALRRMNR